MVINIVPMVINIANSIAKRSKLQSLDLVVMCQISNTASKSDYLGVLI